MALKRYIGPYDAVQLRVAGIEIGIVENGGSIVVPDELVDQVEWPEEHWASDAKPNSDTGTDTGTGPTVTPVDSTGQENSIEHEGV